MINAGLPALITPYGGLLVNLLAPAEASGDLRRHANRLPSVRLSERSVCDLELLATGAFSPLDRFINKEDHRRVLGEMRLANGFLCPIPVTLPVPSDAPVHLDREIALRNAKNEILAVMRVEEIYRWELNEVGREVFGTSDLRHPLIAEMHRWGPINVSGRLQVLQLPKHYDFQDLRLEPREVRARLESLGRKNVVAFQTRNPLHRVHEELARRAAEQVDGVLLLHPAVGMTKPGDVDHYTRVRTYRVLAQRYYDPGRVLLSLLPVAMRLAGPREALWHAVIRRNYGANFLIVGRDHASPGPDSSGKPFYAAYDAQQLVQSFSDELGVSMIPFREMAYLPDEGRYEEISCNSGKKPMITISGTQLRKEYLEKGVNLPWWFTRPEVAELLAEACPPLHRRGFCIWFTGLSGAGKSTTAEVLTVLLLECGRQVTLLDGDEVRTHLSQGLGFSKKDRDANVRRIGFVASEIVRHGGAVIAAAVSPYRAARNDVRSMIGKDRFLEVYVNTPIEICEQRDIKGIYARARRGELTDFTGIDDPYEPPLSPELELDTLRHSPEQNARAIMELLIRRGWVKA